MVKNSEFLAGAKILVAIHMLWLFGMADRYDQVGTVWDAVRPYKLAGRL
jgi:hypothetical protein